MSLSDTFYFIAHPRGDRAKITVIDLAYCVDYERSDWMAVNDKNFDDRDEAIDYARKLASKYGLQYELFESRYDSSLSEKMHLTLDEM